MCVDFVRIFDKNHFVTTCFGTEGVEQMDLLKELPNQLIVVLHGKMTEKQNKKLLKFF
jgi:hypothetical protein